MQREPALAKRIHIVKHARLGVVLHRQLDHQPALLAIGRAVIERPGHAAVLAARQRDMIKHEERPRSEPARAIDRGLPRVGDKIGDLAEGACHRHHIN